MNEKRHRLSSRFEFKSKLAAPRGWSSIAKFLAILFAVLGLSQTAAHLSAQSEGGPFHWVNRLPPERTPLLQHGTFVSQSHQTEIGYYIYLPPGYAQETGESGEAKRYPVVYYLHGGRPGGEQKSIAMAPRFDEAIRAGRVPPMIYVFVNGGEVSHYDFPAKKSYGETAFVKELIPHIDANYRTIASREGRGLEGFSQGGRGTARIMFKYPELFGSAAPMGGGHQHEKHASENDGRETSGIQFEKGNNTYDLAASYVKRMKEWPLPILVAFGKKDFNYEANLEWCEHLKQLSIPFEQAIAGDAPHSAAACYENLGDQVMLFHARNFGLKAPIQPRVSSSADPTRQPSASQTSAPNVIVFLVDDLGQRDLGCYGSTFYETPHVDRLAREGAKFTDAYAACPVCSPTRASLMTGMWPQRVGITDYIGAPMVPQNWKRNTKLLPAPYRDRLELDAPTLAKLMKGAGYATFFAGKWHLGPEGWWPENQGFDINMGGIDRGGPYGGKKYFSPYGNPRLADGPEGEHLPDRLATETTKFIESNRHRPFFAYFSFYSVHTPLMARPDLEKKYLQKKKQMGLIERWGREHERDVRLVQEHAVYAAMVEAMDQAVGKVLAKLDELELADNTLVFFTSDNGGLSTSEGWPTSNLPLRGGKGWMYEGGIREPFVVRWPQRVKAGSVVRTPVSSPDLYATLLDVTQQTSRPGQSVDGLSLLPVLDGHELPERPLFWHYPHYGNQGGAPSAAIRRGNYKLIEWFEDKRVELYDVVHDLSETQDLASSKPELVKRLLDELHAWQKEVGAEYPIPNPAYDASKPSGRSAKRG